LLGLFTKVPKIPLHPTASKKEKRKKKSMETRLWGPNFWTTFDFVAFNYPNRPSKEQQDTIRIFFETMAKVLPCETCKKEFGQLLKQFPLSDTTLKDRDSLTHWLVNVHNQVNERLGKPQVPYETVKAKYESLRGTCPEMPRLPKPEKCSNQGSHFRNSKMLLVLLIALFAAILALFIWYFQNWKR